MTNHEPKHLPADMAGLDGLIELLRADLPEVLCEKHWMVDFDAVEAQRAEAATQLQALAARVKVLEGLLREADVKLTDVQGAYATGQYAANLLARISAALKGTEK